MPISTSSESDQDKIADALGSEIVESAEELFQVQSTFAPDLNKLRQLILSLDNSGFTDKQKDIVRSTANAKGDTALHILCKSFCKSFCEGLSSQTKKAVWALVELLLIMGWEEKPGENSTPLNSIISYLNSKSGSDSDKSAAYSIFLHFVTIVPYENAPQTFESILSTIMSGVLLDWDEQLSKKILKARAKASLDQPLSDCSYLIGNLLPLLVNDDEKDRDEDIFQNRLDKLALLMRFGFDAGKLDLKNYSDLPEKVTDLLSDNCSAVDYVARMAKDNEFESIKKALEAREIPGELDIVVDGKSPLEWAAHHSNAAMFQYFLEKSAVLPAQINGITPLEWAIDRGDEMLVCRFARNTENLLVTGANGLTLLEKAKVKNIHLELPLEYDVLFQAKKKNNFSLIKEFLIKYADWYLQQTLHKSFIQYVACWAAYQGNYEILILLIQKGLQPDLGTPDRLTSSDCYDNESTTTTTKANDSVNFELRSFTAMPGPITRIKLSSEASNNTPYAAAVSGKQLFVFTDVFDYFVNKLVPRELKTEAEKKASFERQKKRDNHKERRADFCALIASLLRGEAYTLELSHAQHFCFFHEPIITKLQETLY